MTVYTEYRKIQHLGNNSLQTFSYNFEIPDEDYAFVYITAASGGGDTEYTDVTWSGIGDEAGGVVVFNTYTPTSTDVITILRDVEIIQETDYIEGGLFRAETTEDTFDYSRFVDQQLKETLDRCIKAAVTDDSSAICMVLETAEVRANKYLWFNEDGCVESREGITSLPVHDHSNNVEGGQLHHHTFVGLLDDDHTQYLTVGRGDARYYTQSQITGLLSSKSDIGHGHAGYAPSPHDNAHHSTNYAPTPHGNDHHGSAYITSNGVTYSNLAGNGDVGTGIGQVAEGSHNHTYYIDDVNSSSPSARGQIVWMWNNSGSNTFGDVFYVNSSGNMMLGYATGYATTPAIAMNCNPTGTTGAYAMCLMNGYAKYSSWNWTSGSSLYLSPSTPGAMTHTIPSSTGQIVQILGVAITSTLIYFNPNYMLIERN